MAATLAAGLLWPDVAHAFEHVEVGVGILGQAGANFLDKPDDQTIMVNGKSVDLSPEYPGFAGFTGGVGGMLDVRIMKYIGIEFDVMHQWDYGTAELKLTNNSTNQTTRYNIEIGNTALHMPLLLKGVLPGEVAQPMLFVGPEFVVPVGEPRAEIVKQTGNVSVGTQYSAVKDSYINVMFGLGMEFVLPIESDDISIRIPLTLRGSVNPGVSGKRTDRANYTVSGNKITNVEYHTEWKFQAVANMGISAHF